MARPKQAAHTIEDDGSEHNSPKVYGYPSVNGVPILTVNGQDARVLTESGLTPQDIHARAEVIACSHRPRWGCIQRVAYD